MLRSVSALFVLAVAATPAAAQPDWSSVEVKATKVVDGLFMLEGAGGNIGLSTGADGAFVIDDQYAPLSEKIVAAVKQQTDQPIAFVLNTHWHGDHTGGNEALGATGAFIVAHDNVRKRLKEGLTRSEGSILGAQETPGAPPGALPVITFSERTTFYWNGREIHVFHPAPAHTDGDAIVHFRDANVVHMGDVFFNGNYPFIDLDSGGDLDGYIAAQEAVLALADKKTKIIPGHGPLASRKDLQDTVDMLKNVRARIQALIDAGKSEDEVIAAKPLADLDADWTWSFIDGEKMTRTAYRSLSKQQGN
jgi:glyoxylase-like metal-dependent hydrolase (beta-lactamase superfamily II)